MELEQQFLNYLLMDKRDAKEVKINLIDWSDLVFKNDKLLISSK